MKRSPLISLKKVWKIYKIGTTNVPANQDISLDIYSNEFVVIVGPSGSGKSTLLNMIGSLDYPTKGTIKLDGKDISLLDESKLAQIRGEKIGFIFQSFHLIPSMTALENVALPMTFQGTDSEKNTQRAKKLLELVELGERMNHLPSELSGGERQRVAIARSLANNPEVIIADEPTGNLDQTTGKKIMKILKDIYKNEGKTVIIVTHDHDLVKLTKSEKIYKLVDGKVQ
tara:strand:+ start:5752 stop:6435 length:684 start_codon:yes stop_codon:yes gene_type:complete